MHRPDDREHRKRIGNWRIRSVRPVYEPNNPLFQAYGGSYHQAYAAALETDFKKRSPSRMKPATMWRERFQACSIRRTIRLSSWTSYNPKRRRMMRDRLPPAKRRTRPHVPASVRRACWFVICCSSLARKPFWSQVSTFSGFSNGSAI